MVRTVPGVPKALVPVLVLMLVFGACDAEPQNWRDFREYIQSVAPDQRDAAVEKFIAAKGGNPIIENQTRLIFFAKDRQGQPPRIVGDFNGWAVTPQGYDVSIGTPTRIEGSSWSYLESTSYTNARLEYVFFFDQEAATDPLNPRTVQAFAGPRSEVRMPFWVAQAELDDTGEVPKGELIAETVTSKYLGGRRRVTGKAAHGQHAPEPIAEQGGQGLVAGMADGQLLVGGAAAGPGPVGWLGGVVIGGEETGGLAPQPIGGGEGVHRQRDGGTESEPESNDPSHAGIRARAPFATQWLLDTTRSNPVKSKRSIAAGKSGRYDR